MIMTFHPPPINLPLEYALDFHLDNNPDYVAITYPSGERLPLKSHTYRAFIPAVHRAGQSILKDAGFQCSTMPASSVVAILVKTDSITYLTVVAGLLRAGLIPFPISPRFSSEVVAHLFRESGAGTILVDNSTRSIAEQALHGNSSRARICYLPSLPSLFPGHNEYTPLPKHDRKPADISTLHHSSSSTAIFPKIIPYSSVAVTHHGEIKDVPFEYLTGKVLGGFGLELFHCFGMCMFFTMVRRGLILAMMDPEQPSSVTPVETSDLYHCFQLCKPDLLIANPRAIETWAEDPEKVAELSDSGVTIYYGGRFVNKNVGDRLVRAGVRICSGYGGTESGPLILLAPFIEGQGQEWEYFTIFPREDVNFVSRASDDFLEVFVAPTEDPSYLSCPNAIWNGRPAFNPGDLFLAHPHRPHTYKIIGRKNDQIMLSTGKWINPLPIEEELLMNSAITSAVMFGHTRHKVGLVVESPDIAHANDKQEFYLSNIWPIIDSVNKKLPMEALITKDMVILTTASKPISISPKGYPRRAIAWLDYQDEIDTLYMRKQKSHM